MPWAPIPGRGDTEIKCKVTMPDASAEVIREDRENTDEIAIRRVKILRKDLRDKYGYGWVAWVHFGKQGWESCGTQ